MKQLPDKYNVLALTPEGLAALKNRTPVKLTRPVSAPEPQAHRVGEIACDEVLFERLADLRKRLADERNVPPYILLSDVSLRQMARDYPGRERDLARVSGMGEKKLRELGALFLAEIARHLQMNPRQVFAHTSFANAPSGDAGSTGGPDQSHLPYDEELFQCLRRVRLRLAEERALPAYIILHDSALRQIAREQPTTPEHLARIRNVGPKKARDFGPHFLAEIVSFLHAHPERKI